jgi:hypothetical protein
VSYGLSKLLIGAVDAATERRILLPGKIVVIYGTASVRRPAATVALTASQRRSLIRPRRRSQRLCLRAHRHNGGSDSCLPGRDLGGVRGACGPSAPGIFTRINRRGAGRGYNVSDGINSGSIREDQDTSRSTRPAKARLQFHPLACRRARYCRSALRRNTSDSTVRWRCARQLPV